MVIREHSDTVLRALAEGLDRILSRLAHVFHDEVQSSFGDKDMLDEFGRCEWKCGVRWEIDWREEVVYRLTDDYRPQLPVAVQKLVSAVDIKLRRVYSLARLSLRETRHLLTDASNLSCTLLLHTADDLPPECAAFPRSLVQNILIIFDVRAEVLFCVLMLPFAAREKIFVNIVDDSLEMTFETPHAAGESVPSDLSGPTSLLREGDLMTLEAMSLADVDEHCWRGVQTQWIRWAGVLV